MLEVKHLYKLKWGYEALATKESNYKIIAFTLYLGIRAINWHK